MLEHGANRSETVLSFGAFRLFPARRLLLEGDRPVRLGSRALDVLIALTERPGELIGKDELMARVWPDTIVEEANIKVQIAALRRAMRDGSGGNRFLGTVPGRGYSFIAPVSQTAIGTPHPPGTSGQAEHLPALLARLIGRDGMIRDLAAMIASHRLVTVTGPGGIGKTSVALAVAEELAPQYPDGVRLVDLSPVTDAALLPGALATVLGLEIRAGDPLQAMIGVLSGKHMLIVLDNCEHLLDGAAQLALAVLKGAPGLHILATSREPLRIQGEHVRQVGPLPSPPPDPPPNAAEAMRFAAVQLFVEQAAASAGDFELTDEDAPAVAEICRSLDGIPLAIEFAAARVGALGVRGLASRLGDRLRLLTQGRRDALARHQTMRAALDWSHDLLAPEEQAAFRQLAIFAGGFTLAAASAVLGSEVGDATELVLGLVGRSMVEADLRGAEPRYRLLETTRAYAHERLEASGELDAVAARHADHYRQLLLAQPRPTGTAELGNIRAAIAWALHPGGNPNAAVELTTAFAPMWLDMSLLGECRERMEAALALLEKAGAVGSRQEMALRGALGQALMFTDASTNEARLQLERATMLAEAHGDAVALAGMLIGLAVVSLRLEDLEAALAIAHRLEVVAARTRSATAQAVAGAVIATVLYFRGSYDAAMAHARRVRDEPADGAAPHAMRGGFDPWIYVRRVETHVLWHQGLFDQSRIAAQAAVAAARAGGNPVSLCYALAWCEAPILLRLGALDAAAASIAALKESAQRSGLRSHYCLGAGLEGQLLSLRGDAAAGERQLRQSLDSMRSAEYGLVFGPFTSLLAAVLAGAGRQEEALEAAAEAVQRIDRPDGAWWLPEALRILGNVRSGGAAPDLAGAERDFRRSLQVAQAQQSLGWELRSATALARLLGATGRAAEARQLLVPVLDRLSEGQDTADPHAARLLLEELSRTGE